MSCRDSERQENVLVAKLVPKFAHTATDWSATLLAQSGHGLVALHMSAFRDKVDMTFCAAHVR